MEATTLLITLPLILFLSFPTNGVSARHGFSIVDESPAVLDASGRELLEGKYYYLRPAIPSSPLSTIAMVLSVYRNDTCWFHVGVERFPVVITGHEAKFLPLVPTNDSSIRESAPVFIEFPDKLASVCGGSSVLRARAISFLSLGGSGGTTSRFKIEKFSEPGQGHIYKLVSSSQRVVGTSTRPDMTERLALTNGNPLPLEFVPV